MDSKRRLLIAALAAAGISTIAPSAFAQGQGKGQDKGQGSNWPEKCKLPSICPKAMRPWGAPIMWVRADWWEVGPLDSG